MRTIIVMVLFLLCRSVRVAYSLTIVSPEEGAHIPPGPLILAWASVSLTEQASALMMTSPRDGDVFHPGDVIALAADVGANEADIRKVTFGGNKGWAQFIYAPGPVYRSSLPMPKEFIGTLTLWVSGIVGPSSNEGVVKSEPITVRIVLPPDVVLQSLRVDEDQEALFLRIASKRKVYVFGRFSDSIERVVSSTLLGTTYQSADQKVASIDTEGLVTAVGPGQTEITVKNGTKQIKIQVYVDVQ